MTFGNVAKDEDYAVDFALRVADGRGAVVDGNLFAIGIDEYGVIGEADNGAKAENFFDGAFDGVAGALVDNAENRGKGLASGVLFGPASEALSHGIHKTHAAFVIGGDDGVADAAHGEFESVTGYDGLLFAGG